MLFPCLSENRVRDKKSSSARNLCYYSVLSMYERGARRVFEDKGPGYSLAPMRAALMGHCRRTIPGASAHNA